MGIPFEVGLSLLDSRHDFDERLAYELLKLHYVFMSKDYARGQGIGGGADTKVIGTLFVDFSR